MIYFAAVIALMLSGTASWEAAINPALALMLFVTFLQVPLAELGRAFGRLRFLGALLAVNFVAVPLLVAILVQFVPNNPMIRLGVLLVLLCPCIDYVVTFAHLCRADAHLDDRGKMLGFWRKGEPPAISNAERASFHWQDGRWECASAIGA